MSFEYINKYYKKEFKEGLVVKVDGKLGVITGTNNAHVKIKLKGDHYAGCKFKIEDNHE